MVSRNELLNAVIEETGLPEQQAEAIVHSVMDTVTHQFATGEPVINMETGTVDLMIEKDTLLRAFVDKANMTATEAQPVIEAVLELMVRL